MDTVLLLARLLLTVVFGVAGIAKLADRKGSRQAMRDFGVPALLVDPSALALPILELTVAFALLARTIALWGAIVAFALLLLFIAGIGANLVRGRRPACHCFGQLHSEPIGWQTILRNGLLAAVAGFVILEGRIDVGPSALAWVSELSAAERIGLVLLTIILGLVALEAWTLLHLLAQNGRVLLRLDALEKRLNSDDNHHPIPAGTAIAPPAGLPVGSPAPSFELGGLYGETLTLEALRAARKPILIAFTDPRCGPCKELMPDLARWQREFLPSLTMVIISRGSLEENRAKSSEYGLAQVLLQKDYEVAQAYRSNGTPGAVIIRPDGTIGSHVAQGADEIRTLLTQTVGAPAAPLPALGPSLPPPTPAPRPVTLPLRAPAPPITLPGLDGKPVALSDFRGSQTLVLFWNPGCGFCQRMLPELKRWEAQPPKNAPKLLIVSSGSVEANRALGLRSPIGLEPSFISGRAFGADGTPSGILVEADGTIASALAVGAPGVLALAGIADNNGRPT